jgi:hypothetical protein
VLCARNPYGQGKAYGEQWREALERAFDAEEATPSTGHERWFYLAATVGGAFDQVREMNPGATDDEVKDMAVPIGRALVDLGQTIAAFHPRCEAIVHDMPQFYETNGWQESRWPH